MGEMQIICAWCKKDLGTKACPEDQHGQITHSICKACADQIINDEIARINIGPEDKMLVISR